MRTIRGGIFTILVLVASFRAPAQSGPPLPPVPLGYPLDWWRFDDTNWLTVSGYAPVSFTNLALVPDWDNNALQVDSTNAAWLQYNVVEANGRTNLATEYGSLSFWFLPNWSSTNQGGAGPGVWARLIDIGAYTTNASYGWWSLYLNPSGDDLFFSAQTNNGVTTNYLFAPVSWDSTTWHLIDLAYSLTNTSLYIDGVLATNGPGISILPGSDVLTNGFYIGSDSNGIAQAHGQFENLWTYDYPLDSNDIAANYSYFAPIANPTVTGGFHTDGSGTFTPGITTNSQYSSNELWLAILGPGTNGYNTNANASNVTVFLNNTIADIEYELLTTTNPNVPWTIQQTVIGSEVTNYTVTTVPLTNLPTVFFSALAYTLDSDNVGIPDWWQLKYFGYVGIDPYGDPAGDGWSNIQKYENGMNPNLFYTPPQPGGVSARVGTNGNVLISWAPAANLPTNGAGAVTGYTIYFDRTNFTVGASQTNLAIDGNPDVLGYLSDTFEYGPLSDVAVQVNYASTNSLWTQDYAAFNPQYAVEVCIARGQNGRLNLIISAVPPGVWGIRVFVNTDNAFPQYPEHALYPSIEYPFTNQPGSYSFDVPIASFSNGIYTIPDSALPLYGWYQFQTSAIGNDGTLGPPPPDLQYVDENPTFELIPFLDGRSQIKQDLAFWLQAATKSSPFGFKITGGASEVPPGNVAYAGFHYTVVSDISTNAPRSEFKPFEDNYGLRNFLFAVGNLNLDGSLGTGVYYDSGDTLGTYNTLSNAEYYFDTTGFANAEETNPPAAILTNLQWTYYANQLGLSDIGISLNTGVSPPEYLLSSGQSNFFGLAYESAERAYSSNGISFLDMLSAGGSLSDHTNNYFFYPGTAAPELETVNYYFARPGIDPLPDDPAFAVTNATPPLMIASVGKSFQLSAWAKQAILNGDSSKYAYPEQYFDQAYAVDTNGVVTTNTTGILSPYGDFFPTQPGPTALVTMPDMDTGQCGTNIIQVISLNVDANHDGIMDTSFTGPDTASSARPFVFWANNNYDRFTLDSDDGVEYDDSVQIAGDYFTPNNPVPDCNFKDGAGNRAIPCDRDLEDFTRLWIAGITTNLLTNLPSGSTITLTWGDVGSPNTNNPTIDLFEAADADGGIGYLTNSTTAAIQTLTSSCPYVGRLGPGQSIQLNGSQFANHWAGNHFIWCGVNYGSGALTLTIADGSGNTLAQTVAYIQIVDIKQMYERWTVGDAPSVAPTNTARLAEDNFPPGLSPIPFQYGTPTDTNTPYILLVHGWNNPTWNKDAFAESAFKRLYWQGYHGRFGSFQWPTTYGFTGSFWQALTDPRSYDNGEFQAWQSAQGLMNKLNDLNGEYPGHVYMLAHSMGNVVAGEALRLAAQNGLGQIVNTYVASQAALSAHNYDATVTTPYLLPFTYKYPSGLLSLLGTNNYGPYAPDIYVNRLTNNIAAVGRRISFYNQNDFALAMPRWGFDSILRPDHPVGGYYYYSGSTSDAAPWNHFEFVFTAGDPPPSPTDFDIVSNLHDRYEVMAYAAPSYSTALGATPNVLNISQNLDLTTVWPTDTSGHSYADHYWHSAEFRGDYWQEQSYWHTLLYSSTYGFNISNP